jgi:hypothetical protein
LVLSGVKQISDVYIFEKIGSKATTFDYHVVQMPLLVCLFQNVFLDGVFRNKAVDMHVSRLSYAVTTILRLINV